MGGRFGMGALYLIVLFFLTVRWAESLPLLSIEPAMSQVQAGTGRRGVLAPTYRKQVQKKAPELGA